MLLQGYVLAGLCLVTCLNAEYLQEVRDNKAPAENEEIGKRPFQSASARPEEVIKAPVGLTVPVAPCMGEDECSWDLDVGLHVLQTTKVTDRKDRLTEEVGNDSSSGHKTEEADAETEDLGSNKAPKEKEEDRMRLFQNMPMVPEEIALVQLLQPRRQQAWPKKLVTLKLEGKPNMSLHYLSAHGVVASNPFRMPSALGPNPSVSSADNASLRHETRVSDTIPCNQFINARHLYPQSQCPSQCPYFAERMAEESKPCVFSCRKALECGKLGTDPLARVPDKAHGYCRRCSVVGCEECSNVASDTCAKCAPGYWLQHGQCKSLGLALWIIVLTTVCILIMLILIWFFDLLCRRGVNQKGVQEGHDFRARCILRKQDGTSTDDAPYPLTTNLLQSPIAGRGTTLMFNFQLFLIVWSGAMLSGWSLFALCAGGHAIFSLGFQQADTPLQYCLVVHRGFTVQHSLMWIKWVFCLVAYGLSFTGAIVYAVVQERRFQMWDANATTMMDFAALCRGLPRNVGATKVEEDVANTIYDQCGEFVVGVSVCWDLSSHCLYVDSEGEAFGDEGGSFESSALQAQGFDAHSSVDSDKAPGPIRRIMDIMDSLVAPVFGVPSKVPSASRGTAKCNIRENLEAFRSTGVAFVVFETEAGRNRATQHAGGLEFKGSCMQLEVCDCEPETVLWQNIHVRQSALPWRVALGVAVLLSFLLLWVLLFFLPATLYLASFIDLHDGQPSYLYTILFSLLVVTGNQIMYNASDVIASAIGFHYEDNRQVAYVMMYTAACILQVVLDLAFCFKTSYRDMVARGVRTDDGRLIGQLHTYEGVFEAYAMQRAIGRQLYGYVWPATFLIPYLLEPLGTILLPYVLQRSLVRCKAWIVGHAAEKSMAHFLPMDLSRYGDVLLNTSLVALFAFMPPGLWSSVLAFFVLSHFYIYGLDHLRVLRFIPAFCFSGSHMHNAAQYMFAFPVAVLLAAAVFKSNCTTLASGKTLPCAHGFKLLGRCLMAAVCHVVLHVAMLRYVVPVLGRLTADVKDPSPLKYQEAVQALPKTWFSMNKLHCLRSKYIYQHLEPCRYYCLGERRSVVASEK